MGIKSLAVQRDYALSLILRQGHILNLSRGICHIRLDHPRSYSLQDGLNLEKQNHTEKDTGFHCEEQNPPMRQKTENMVVPRGKVVET